MQITESFLKDLIIRHEFLTQVKLKSLCELQEKLKNNKLPKTLLEIFQYKKVFSENRLSQLLSLVEFFNTRVNDSLICQIAIDEKIVSQELYEKSLITQRAIYSVKETILPLKEIFFLKGEKGAWEKVESKLSSLSKEDFAKKWKKQESEITKEDTNALKWRRIHLGKDIPQNTENTSPPSKLEENTPPPSKLEENTPPPSKLEENTPPPSKLEENTPPPTKLEKDITTFSLEKNKDTKKNIHKHQPQSSSPKELSIPPSKITENETPPSKLSPPPPLSTTQPQQNFDIDQDKQQNQLVIKSFIIATIVLVGIFTILYLNNSTDKKDFSVILQLIERQENVEAEKKSRVFLQNYPESKHVTSVKKSLQDILIRKAQISLNQEKIEESASWLEEANLLGDYKDKRISTLQEKIVQQQQITARKNTFDNALQKAQKSIASNDFESAQLTIDNIKIRFQKNWAKKDIEILQDKLNLSKHKFAQETYKYIDKLPDYKQTQLPKLSKKLDIQILSLGEVNKQSNSLTQTNFFAIAKNHMYCFDGQNGKTKWVTSCINNSIQPIFLAGPKQNFNMKIADRVLLLKTPSILSMLKTNDGTVLWELKIPGIVSSQLTLHKQRIYLGTYDNHCLEIDVQNGNILGGYRTGETPVYAPTIDKKLNLIFIPCHKNIYVYNKNTGQLTYTIPYEKKPCASTIAVSPYLCTFTTENSRSYINTYKITPQSAQLLKTIEVEGEMTTPAAMSCGNLAVATNKHLKLFALNPKNVQESIFPLNRTSSILLNDSKTFMQFSNLGRSLTISSQKLFAVDIQLFSKRIDVIQKKWQLTYKNKNVAMPIQKTRDTLFTVTSDNNSYIAHCFTLEKETPTQLWEKRFAFASHNKVLQTKDKRTFITTTDGSIHELFSKDNKINYRIAAYNTAHTPLVAVDKQHFFSINNGQAQLINNITGWPIWKSDKINNHQKYIGACVGKGSIFFSYGKTIFALDIKTGKKSYLEYSEFKGNSFSSNPYFHENSIFIGSKDGYVYELGLAKQDNISFLQKKWSFATEGAVTTTPLYFKNTLYFADHHLYAIDLLRRRLKWSIKTSGKIYSQPVIDNNILYFGNSERQIYAVDILSGKTKWRKKITGKVTSSPLITKEKVYFTSVAGEVLAFSKEGKLVWQVNIIGAINCSPFIINQKIAVISDNGFVYFIEEK
ncbi:PQQ-binding-like beta-propeller repeat protein [Candidatus Uabimicrobium sp. HlEnr_7]|uniref:outer membrane protein assembly factor BamB family protein n=1 Tax=Candidatus Uabimicrobium helgolandensis TaxID=3095367 RepID=UPI0035572A9C